MSQVSCRCYKLLIRYLVAVVLRTWVLFVGPLIPVFWASVNTCSGFQGHIILFSSLVMIYRKTEHQLLTAREGNVFTGVCPRGTGSAYFCLLGWVSVQGGLCPGGSLSGGAWMETLPVGIAAIGTPLECILVSFRNLNIWHQTNLDFLLKHNM